MKQAIAEITQRIQERSAATRRPYLARLEQLANRGRGAERFSPANVAHAFAGLPQHDKIKIVVERAPNLGIVTAYNDMLSSRITSGKCS